MLESSYNQKIAPVNQNKPVNYLLDNRKPPAANSFDGPGASSSEFGYDDVNHNEYNKDF